MSELVWDEVGQRFYETGIDRGVLYLPDQNGAYVNGVAWNGLVSVSESPTGAEPNAQYADNIKYLNLFSAEEFEGTIEAFTYPKEFQKYDGLHVPVAGIAVGQQSRPSFGLAYRTKVGNDLVGDDFGYKIHLVYGCQVSPSEKAFQTINDSSEAITFSWDLTTTPVAYAGGKPTALITIDSTEVAAADLAALETILYGTEGVDPAMPLPDAVVTLFSGGATSVSPQEPAFDSGTNTITIPAQAGVEYYIDGEMVAAGAVVITEDTFVTARPADGYFFPDGVDDDWLFIHT